MQTMRSGILAASLLLVVPTVYADTTARAKVGTLEYSEGAVLVNGRTLAAEKTGSQALGRGDMLSTQEGHAEMLLTPGIDLRLGRNSSARLVNDSLTDTRVRLEQGSAMLEVDNLHKENSIAVEVGDSSARVRTEGLYRFEANPPAVEVLKGEVEATQGSLHRKAGKHHQLALNAELRNQPFKEDKNDELDRWSRLRSEYEAEANVASAQYVYNMGWGWRYADWYWNPWFGSWTWLPARAWYVNPYGFSYWSPLAVYRAFPARYYYGTRPAARVATRGGFSRGAAMRSSSMGRMSSSPRGRGR